MNATIEKTVGHPLATKDILADEDVHPLRRLTDDEKRSLVEDVVSAAIGQIQNAIGVQTGDNATIYFCGERGNSISDILNGYIDYEIRCENQYKEMCKYERND